MTNPLDWSFARMGRRSDPAARDCDGWLRLLSRLRRARGEDPRESVSSRSRQPRMLMDDRVRVDTPAFDLVLATVGRTTELRIFLEGLQAQSYRNVRVILIDQNEDERLGPILADLGGAFPLLRVRSGLGISRSRNVGLRHLEGDVVSFPDDDCCYPPELLQQVVDTLRRSPDWDGVAGRTVDQTARSSLLLWRRKPGLVTRGNVWSTAVSVTIFLRRPVVDRVGLFDESLGAGAGTPWGSGEETDYLLRALSAGFTVGYDPDLCIFHDSPSAASQGTSTRKGYVVGMGNSRVLRKHGYPLWFAAYRFLQLATASAVFLALGRPAHARFYWAMARGRAKGWVQARPSTKEGR